MRSRGGLKRWPNKQPPPPAVREAIATIQRYLAQGCTPDELARAQAALDAPRETRQAQLELKVRP